MKNSLRGGGRRSFRGGGRLVGEMYQKRDFEGNDLFRGGGRQLWEIADSDSAVAVDK